MWAMADGEVESIDALAIRQESDSIYGMLQRSTVSYFFLARTDMNFMEEINFEVYYLEGTAKFTTFVMKAP